MSLNYSIQHNGSTWTSENKVESLVITNGSVNTTITEAGIKTLNCKDKYMPNNLVIGEKILNCAGKIMADNVVITTIYIQDLDKDKIDIDNYDINTELD